MMETKCTSGSHLLPNELKWAGRGCKHSTIENMPRKEFLALDRVRCTVCRKALGILCLECGRVY